MTTECNTVAERVALGEPLADLAAHAASCARCQRVIAMPAAIASAADARDPAGEPGPGFAARITVGAQRRLVERKRNRIIATVSLSAAAAAVVVLVATRLTQTPESTVATSQLPAPPEPTVTLDTADLEFLVTHADVERSSRLSADWKHIKKPLVRYAKLLEGTTP